MKPWPVDPRADEGPPTGAFQPTPRYVRHSFSYDRNGNLASFTNGEGNIAGASRRGQGPLRPPHHDGLRPKRQPHPPHRAGCGHLALAGPLPGLRAGARHTTYAYDGRDLQWRETVGEGSYRRTTVTEYDANGNLRRTVNPRGVTEAGDPVAADDGTDGWEAAEHATVNECSADDQLVTTVSV